ncbi:hypothetical protein TWF694_009478 [Orbilia ellipsospora]|uniref:Uncharacterized protein n=1 Tax=Orbilia ellipsospora TaxID=2528407 RepID=A0AAV9XAY3_9PEZI
MMSPPPPSSSSTTTSQASKPTGYPLPPPERTPSDLALLYPQPFALPDRLGLHLAPRIFFANLTAFTTVFLTTSVKAGHAATLQFRAENAHRLPRSQVNWYFYHRSKSYYASRAAFTEGFKRGVGMCGYVSLFLMLEGRIDVLRGGVDFGATVLSGGVTGAVFGVVRKLPPSTTGLMVRKGLWYGFLYGFVQDVLLGLQGKSVSWIDPVVGAVRGDSWRALREEKERRGSLQENER